MRTAIATTLVLLAAGCLGVADAEELQLSSRTGGGAFYIAITVAADGTVERTTAWWADSGQSFNTDAYHLSDALQGVVIKNDVGLEGDVPILTDGDRLVFLWSNDDSGSMARPGDSYEFYVMERTTDRVLASATLAITG